MPDALLARREVYDDMMIVTSSECMVIRTKSCSAIIDAIIGIVPLTGYFVKAWCTGAPPGIDSVAALPYNDRTPTFLGEP